MKVETAIGQLNKLNPEAELRCGHYFGSQALFIVYRNNNPNIVWIECEEDIDLGAELEARYEYAAENQIDELDFYMDLLEIGITVDMIHKYMGDEHADHMKTFCEEHGLI